MNTLNKTGGAEHTNFQFVNENKYGVIKGFVIYQKPDNKGVEYIHYEDSNLSDWLSLLLANIAEPEDPEAESKVILFTHYSLELMSKLHNQDITNEKINNTIINISNFFYEMTDKICYFTTNEIEALKLHREYSITGSGLGAAKDRKLIENFYKSKRKKLNKQCLETGMKTKKLFSGLKLSECAYVLFNVINSHQQLCLKTLKKEAKNEAHNYIYFSQEYQTNCSNIKKEQDLFDSAFFETALLKKAQIQNKISHFDTEVA